MMTITTPRATALFAVAALALAACSHDGPAASPGAGAPRPPRATSPAIGELIAAVPGDATALGFLDIDDAPWSLLTGGGPFALDPETRKTLDRELREYVTRYLGLDLTRLQRAVGFVSGPPMRGAVLLNTVGGALKLPGASPYEGGSLWRLDPARGVSLAISGGIVVLGNDAAVREVLETQAGKRKPVSVDNKPLVDWLRKDSEGAVLAFAAIKPAALHPPPPFTGVERLAVTLRAGGITAMLDGDDASISALQAIVDQAYAAMLAEVTKAHDAAIAGTVPPPEGAIAIIASAYARSYAAKLKPRRTGNRLSSSLELGAAGMGATTVVSMIGILSAVAIPSFMDYTKRAKKTEAALQLNKLGRNAKRAYVESGRFPAGAAPLTPPQRCCGQPTSRCPAVPALYATNPTWLALDFQIDEPTLFQYAYSASADGQRFTAKAVGDLDCDGIPITYELAGAVVNGTPTITLTEPAPNSD